MDDRPSIRSAHKPPNLFLDDDEEDQDDFMFEKPTKSGKSAQPDKSQSKTSSRSKINSINLFADDEGDDFDSFLPTTSKAAAKLTHKKPEIKNLFDDDDEDDDDDELFLQPTEPAKTTTTPRTTILSNAPIKTDLFHHNIFDDEPPEDDFENRPSTSNASSSASTVKTTPRKPSDLFSTKVNLFDDDDDDDIFDKLITPTSSSKKDLFKEESKSEISFETEPETESKQVDKIEEKKNVPTAKPRSKTNLFDPGRLFDDSPPSDDEQLFSSMSSKRDAAKPKSSDTSKQNTGEFYNDFSETVTSMPTPSESISSDITETFKKVKPTKTTPAVEITEKASVSLPKQEPESESNTRTIEDKPKLVSDVSSDDGSPSKNRSEFLKKIDSFSNPNMDEHKSETAPTLKTKQPKKLNIGNIDINVAALLPGAKRAKSVEKRDNKEASDDKSNDESSPETSTATKMVSQDNVDSSGRLANLNRNRAKNLSRRPSTRAGRKQQYQKSAESEEQIDGISEQIEQSKPVPKTTPPKKDAIKKEPKQVAEEKVEKSDIPPSPSKNLPKSPLNKTIFEDDLFETDTQPPPLETVASVPVEPEVTDEIENVPIQPEIEESQSNVDSIEKENPFSFLDEQEDEIDDFMVEPETPPKPPATIVKATPAYIDELPPELDPIDDKSSSNKNEKGNPLLSRNALSLFGDEDDDDFDNDDIFVPNKTDNQPDLPSNPNKSEDDWSPYSTSYIKETPPASNDKKPNIPSVLKLFDDDLENDDDIFSIKSSSESKAEVKNGVEPPNIVPSLRNVIETSPPSSDERLPASSVLELFDDDIGDVNLFGSTNSTVSTSEVTLQKQQSVDSPSTSHEQETPSPVSSDKKLPVSSALDLFDDGDLVDNDISDTKTSKETKSETNKGKTKSAPVASKAARSKAAGLFGDDDDDDDLFGGPPSPQEPVKQSRPKKAASKIFSDDSSDDDLFGGGKTAKKNPSKPSTSATTTSTASKTKDAKSNDKLFSDSEDDDDDLFGSKSKPTGNQPFPHEFSLNHLMRSSNPIKYSNMQFVSFLLKELSKKWRQQIHRSQAKKIHRKRLNLYRQVQLIMIHWPIY